MPCVGPDEMRRVRGFDFVVSGSVMSFDSSVADVGMLQENLYL